MKHSKESRNIVRQNDKIAQKSQKHDANLQKNSALYFQVGLILCLLASYAGLEMQFEKKNVDLVYNSLDNNELLEHTPEIFEIYKEPKAEMEPIPEPKKIKSITQVEVVDKDTEIKTLEKNVFKVEKKTTTKVYDSSSEPTIENPDDDGPFNILSVQKVQCIQVVKKR